MAPEMRRTGAIAGPSIAGWHRRRAGSPTIASCPVPTKVSSDHPAVDYLGYMPTQVAKSMANRPAEAMKHVEAVIRIL